MCVDLRSELSELVEDDHGINGVDVAVQVHVELLHLCVWLIGSIHDIEGYEQCLGITHSSITVRIGDGFDALEVRDTDIRRHGRIATEVRLHAAIESTTVSRDRPTVIARFSGI